MAGLAALLITLVFTLVHGAVRAQVCIQAAQWGRTPGPVGYVDQLKHRSRTPPPREPALSTSDWDPHLTLQEPPAFWPSGEGLFDSPQMFMAVKVYKGVVYVSWPYQPENETDPGRQFWHQHWEVILEQIVVAVWLFKEFPDVEFGLNILDTVWPMYREGPFIPFLQFATLSSSLPIHQTASGYNTAYWNKPRRRCPQHTRGWAVPHPDAWWQSSLSPEQLQFYSYCVHYYYGGGNTTAAYAHSPEAHGPLSAALRWVGAGRAQPKSSSSMHSQPESSPSSGRRLKDWIWPWPAKKAPNAPAQVLPPPNGTTDLAPFLALEYQSNWADTHKPAVIWRGSTTGGRHDYYRKANPLRCIDTEELLDTSRNMSYLSQALLNKRLFAAVTALPYPWLDVALSVPHHRSIVFGLDNISTQLTNSVDEMAVQPGLPLEAWSQYQLALNIDGHGPAFRLPRLLLGMVPVLKVESLQQEYFANDLLPHVHYEPLHFDMRDLATHSQHVLAQAHRSSKRLQRMAIAARNLMVKRLHLLAQLDTVMWSILRVKEVCQWEVQAPGSQHQWSWGREGSWVPLQLPRNRTWKSPLLVRLGIGATIADDMPSNFYTP